MTVWRAAGLIAEPPFSRALPGSNGPLEFPVSLIKLWSPFFPPSARRAAYPLFEKRQAKIQIVPLASSSGSVASSEVLGPTRADSPLSTDLAACRITADVTDGDDRLQVEIEASRAEEEAFARCTCSDFEAGRFCCHIWAVILTLNHDSRPPEPDDEEPDPPEPTPDQQAAATTPGAAEPSAGPPAGPPSGPEAAAEPSPDGSGSPDPSSNQANADAAHGPAAAPHADNLSQSESHQQHLSDEGSAKTDLHHLQAVVELLGRLTPSQPRAARREIGTSVIETPRGPEWQRKLLRLSLQLQPQRPEPPTSIIGEGRGQILYSLDSGELVDHHRVVIYPYLRKMGQSGQWGAARLTALDQETLSGHMAESEQELVQLLTSRAGSTGGDQRWGSLHRPGGRRIVLDPAIARLAIGRLLATGRLFLAENWNHPLSWDKRQRGPWQLVIEGRWNSSGGLSLRPVFKRKGARLPLDEVRGLVPGRRGLLFYPPWVGPINDPAVMTWIRFFLPEGRFVVYEVEPLVIANGEIHAFLQHLLTLPELPKLDLPDDVPLAPRDVAMVPKIELATVPENGKTRSLYHAEVTFLYEDQQIAPGQAGHYIPTDPKPRPSTADQTPAPLHPAIKSDGTDGWSRPTSPPIQRDLAAERKAARLLVRLGFQAADPRQPNLLRLPARAAGHAVTALLKTGWEVLADRQTLRRSGDVKLSVGSGIDWFELSGGVSYDTGEGEQVVPIAEILRLARSGRRMIRLQDGSQGLLPEAWLKQHGLLAQIGQLDGDILRFTNSQAAVLDALLSGMPEVDIDARFAEARQKLRQFERLDPMPASERFLGQLRTYQQIGLGWLAFLRAFQMGGILADDMGLGKTIQVLAWLDRLHGPQAADTHTAAHEGNGSPPRSDNPDQNAASEKRPFLVVAPRSVVFNWLDEAQRFTPHLKAIVYSGADRVQLREEFDSADLIITSYGLLRRDVTDLYDYEFDTLVLDEAQAIKNPGSQGAKAARLLKARHRLALTGTPVENHLGDLWSIFEFLNPGLLGSGSKFNQLVKPGTGLLSVDAARNAGRALRPFILRRTKKQVLTELPEKTEQTLLCEMDIEQRKIYDSLKSHYQTTLLSQIDRAGGNIQRSAFQVLEALLRLRQAACHPALIDSKFQTCPSAKLDTLLEQVEELLDEGHKALIFSQFTSFLALVKSAFDQRGTRYEYLDGQTRDRRTCVERFQTDADCGLFLISLKAGGLGLNLTAADYVFILDPWWNPAVEQQAIDRAHRIGQTRHVTAYRLICEDTVEQRIAELQQRKQEVADAIVEGRESMLQNLTREDLEQLLS